MHETGHILFIVSPVNFTLSEKITLCEKTNFSYMFGVVFFFFFFLLSFRNHSPLMSFGASFVSFLVSGKATRCYFGLWPNFSKIFVNVALGAFGFFVRLMEVPLCSL